MELRHLRYFVAVADEGSLTVAAEKRLHTEQPSLSRQMRDHARLALTQAEAAVEAARRAAEPLKPPFALGFLTGMEIDWLPKAMRILQDQLPNMKLTIASQYSPDLAAELMRGRLDAAFMRAEPNLENLVYRRVLAEPLVVVLPSDHRLASRKSVDLRALVGETFITTSNTAPTLRSLIAGYLQRSGLDIKPAHEVDHLAHAVSMVASTGGVMLLPDYARNFLPRSVTSRPLRANTPTIDLVVGYNKANRSPILELFLSRLEDIAAAPAREP
jgi:LysR family hca operon transcriptional activator